MGRTKTLSEVEWELSCNVSNTPTEIVETKQSKNADLIKVASMIKDLLTSGSVNINIHVYHHYDD